MNSAETDGAATTDAASLELRIKRHAVSLGFDLVGIAQLGPAETAPYFEEWIAAGRAGAMGYLERGTEKRRDTRLPYPGVSSAIVVALNYGGTQPPGPFARYARGNDYHDVMLDKLDALHAWLAEITNTPIHGKAYVDTGPILERDLARRAGLGWFGKNTNLINPRLGSFFFIGTLLVDLPLQPDQPFVTDHCGTCTRCLDACPTQAFNAPHTLDATRCISYLTIELRGSIPELLRAPMGDHVYGCDVCQDVCPWNIKFSRDLRTPELAPRPALEAPDLPSLLNQDDDAFRTNFRGSPVKRTKRHGLARNAAVVLGNRGTPRDLPVLQRAAEHDPHEMVREHAQWAIAQIERRYSAPEQQQPEAASDTTVARSSPGHTHG
jgi:epoxyqueuosine reductase